MSADGAYAGDELKDALRNQGDRTVELVKLSDGAKEFVLFPRRSAVERTLARVNHNRCPAKDFEATIESAATWLYIASLRLSSYMAARPIRVE